MRNVVMMAVSAILGVLTLLIIMSIAGRSNRSMELKSNFSSIVEETVEELLYQEAYSIQKPNEFLADFMEALCSVLDSDCEVQAEVMQVDTTRGLLSMKVTETYHNPNGKTGTLETEKTVILNGKAEKPAAKQYAVRFYLSKEDMGAGTVLKECLVYGGDVLGALGAPKLEGKAFAGWKDGNDYLADFSLPIEQDRAYYAVWN